MSIVFLGDSITEFVDFDKVLPAYHIINHGIAGDTTPGVLRRLGQSTALKPRKLFLLIGTNDIGDGVSVEAVASNIKRIVSRIKDKTPGTRIYLQAVFPTRNMPNRLNALIQELNAHIQEVAREFGCTYIDLYPLLLDESGSLGQEYTVDGLHLSDKAVAKWMEFLAPYLDE